MAWIRCHLVCLGFNKKQDATRSSHAFFAFYLVGKQQHQNENVTVFMKQTGHLHAIVAEFRGLLRLCFAEHLHVRHWCWQGLKF